MSKLTDKAKGISFDDVDEADAPRAPEPVPDRPRTAIGAISASLALGRGVEAKNRELQARLAQFEEAAVVELIDPQRIQPSRYANRHELSFASPAFELLKAEIASAGRNVQPIKVRPMGGKGGLGVDGLQRYEIAFGHRRHRACLELGLPVAAVVENLSDAQLFGEMERENRARADLSPWEQGMMYKRALDQGLFQSQRQLAVAVGAQSGNVSTAIQIASLPMSVVNAFRSPLDLQFRWGPLLKSLVDREPERVLGAASELAALNPKLTAKEVVARLMGEGGSTDAPSQFLSHGVVVGSWEKDARGALVVRLKPDALAPAKERRLLEFVAKLVE